MKNIVHFAWYAAPYGGSFIKQIVELEKELSNKGYNLILVLPINAKEKGWCKRLLEEKKVKIRFLNQIEKGKQRTNEINKIVEKEQPLIIHSHFGTIENELLIVSKKRKIPFVYHSRADIPKSKNLMQKVKYKIKYSLVYSKVYIIGLNKNMGITLKNYGFNMKYYYEIPEAIDFKRLDKKSGAISRNNFGLTKEDNVTLMMGYDMNIKGVDFALKAFEKIKDEHYKLLIVMAKNREKNIERIKEMYNGKIPNNILIAGPTEYIRDYYDIANQFLSASRTEGFSNAILEAIYLKNKVIVSDIPGVEWAKKYKNVITYNLENIIQLRESILNQNRIEEKEFKEIQKEVVREFGLEIWKERMMNLYNAILRRKNEKE